MSQIYKNSGGGGGGTPIETINGDSGSITGSTVTIYANQAALNSGASVAFVNSGTVSTLNVTDSRDSTYIGEGAGQLIGVTTGGNANTAVGASALSSVSNSGNVNCAFGNDSLQSLTNGDFNTACGVSTAELMTTGAANSLFGYVAGQAYTTSESNNIVIGANVLGTAGESGVIRIGDSASVSPQTTCFIAGIAGVLPATASMTLINPSTGQLGNAFNVVSTGSNTIIGGSAGNYTLTGTENTGYGATSLVSVTSGVFNTAIGARSQNLMQSGNSNTSVGLAALRDCVSGSENCAFGEECLTFNTASQNSCFGSKSMNASGAGSENSCFGYASGNAISSGSSNALFGNQAGDSITTGSFNMAFGNDSLSALTTGDYNIAVGTNSGNALTTSDSSNILINSVGVSGESNAIRIGTQGGGGSQQNTCYIAGIVGATAGTNPTPILIGTNGKLSSADPTTGLGFPFIYSGQVNLLATGATQLTAFSSSVATAFIITSITAVGTNITGVFGGGTADFGTNGPTYDNYVIGFNNFAPVQDQYVFSSAPGLVQVPVNTPFFINVTAADATATTDTQTIYIQGFYI